MLSAGVNCPLYTIRWCRPPSKVQRILNACQPISLIGQSLSPWKMGSKDLIIFPFQETLTTRGIRRAGVNKGEHGGLEGRTEGGLTFYFSSRGRDFRHTQVGGGHDVIVGKAVPTAGKQRGPHQGKGLADHSSPRRKWTLLGAPVFILGVILRPGNPRDKEPGKKVLLESSGGN